MEYYCIEIENYRVICLSSLPMEEGGGDNVGFTSVKIYKFTIEFCWFIFSNQGIHPTIRGEVWEFLLGCYDPKSTTEERDEIRKDRR